MGNVDLKQLSKSTDNLTSEYKVSDLPPELLLHIFRFLDGLSLARISSTCSRFYSIVNNDMPEKWKQICKTEVEDAVMLDVSYGKWKALWRNGRDMDPNVPWRQLHRSIMMWRSVKHWRLKTLECPSISIDEITCLAVAGEYVVFGTKSGAVLQWSPYSPKSYILVTEHDTEVKNIAIMVSDERDYEDEDLKYRIVSISRCKSLEINDIEGLSYHCLTPKRLMQNNIMSCQDALYEWGESINKLYRLMPALPTQTITRLHIVDMFIPFRNGRLLAFSMLDGGYAITQQEGPMKYVEVPTRQNPRVTRWTWKSIAQSCLQNVTLRRGYIWEGGVTLSITYEFDTLVTIGMEYKYIRWPSCAKPMSALLYGNALIIGTDTGHVVIYCLKTRESILDLRPEEYEVRYDTEIIDPILYLAVREPEKEGKYPEVIAATKRNIVRLHTSGFSASCWTK